MEAGMGAPESGMTAAEQPSADALLTLRTIRDGERVKHVAVLDYWLSIRGDKEFPPLHELDPLEISDAAPCSILLELIGGGQDAEIRHLGDTLSDDVTVQRVIDAPNPSLLASIARKLPIVAISRDFLAFEDSFTNADGLTRCWVTLLPLSSCGSWVDYVYAFVSIEKASAKAAKADQPDEVVEAVVEDPVAEETEVAADEPVAEEPEPVADEAEAVADEPEPVADEVEPVADEAEAVAEAAANEPEALEAAPVEAEEPEAAVEEAVEPLETPEAGALPDLEELDDDQPAKGPGFSKLFEGFASLTGFYNQGIKIPDPVINVEPPASELPPLELEALEPEAVEPLPEPEEEAAELSQSEVPEPAAEVPPLELDQPAPVMEGNLQIKLTEVRAKADEARQAALRATAALHEGLSAAYDFALDAETSPEEYLRLVEAEGLKIQLRAPMAPVARLAFNGLVDPATLGQCEQILSWALKAELPRGALLERIDQAGGITELVGEVAKAA